ncbi:Venom allergen 5.01 [Blattella germanica]|nr:Venom allergen 5.01 [Blattella germanica]
MRMDPTFQLMLLQVLCACIATSQAYYQQSCAGKTLLRSGGLTCQDRQVILDAHNNARLNVALGRVPGQPGATKMLELVWDDKLAQVAQRWADKCTIAHDKSRHECNTVSGGPEYSSNMDDAEESVTRTRFRQSSQRLVQRSEELQLIWGDTYLVGCGYTHYFDPSRGNTKLYVCNYGPA